jgi:hypothetical protein
LRNGIAIIFGTLISFSLIAITGFIVIHFKIYPFYDFVSVVAVGDESKFFKLGENVLYAFIFIIFPLVALATGFSTALISRQKEYLLGIISTLPLFIIFFIYSSSVSIIESIYALFICIFFPMIGVFIAKSLRR